MLDDLLIKLTKKASKNMTDQDIIPYDLESNTPHIQKYALDLYRIDNDPYRDLWLLEEDKNGKKFLVRASDPQCDTKDDGDWSAISDFDQKNVTLAYKHVPISRFSSIDYNFTPEDIITFKDALLDKVSSDKDFVKEVLAAQPTAMRTAIVQTFPELNPNQEQ